ncbi:hypothetical protein ACF0H5_015689 [Mactra antiquata]
MINRHRDPPTTDTVVNSLFETECLAVKRTNQSNIAGTVTIDNHDILAQCRFPRYLKMVLNITDSDTIIFNLRKIQRTEPSDHLTSFLSDILSRDSRKSKRGTEVKSGLFVYEGMEYVLTPLKGRHIHTGYDDIRVNLHLLIDQPSSHHYLISEKSRIHHIDTDNSSTTRHRREIAHSGDVLTFTIDVLVVVDYNVYSKWLTNIPVEYNAVKDIYTRREIHRYYHHVINGVDLRYQSIEFRDFQIRVRLAGIVIIDDEESMNMSRSRDHDNSTTTTTIANQMNADKALKIFRIWMNDTEGLPQHDHAILFTGHDLYTLNSSKERVTHTSGLAFIGTLCEKGDSVSIVEEHGGFQSVGTAAHEIGHSLGSLHDGENNTCESEDRYIMASSGFGAVPEDKKFNPWFFSKCSVEYIKNYIVSMLIDGTMCLLDSEPRDSRRNENKQMYEQDDVIELPGQRYSPDNQCRLIWGPKSYLCRGAEFGNASTICTAMYCRDPSTLNDCVLHTAARGTSCGNKKWCSQGQCEYSENAPEKTESCVLGDQPGPAFNDMTCQQLVSKSASYCYQDKVKARCCNACGTVEVNRKGCEYGDRIQGCQPWHCSHVFTSRDIHSECCGTCLTGMVLTTVARSAQVIQHSVTTQSPKMWNDATCSDTYMSKTGMSCSDYIRAVGSFVCYGDITSKKCCRSCNRVRKHVHGCEYGDRVPSLCSQMRNQTLMKCEDHGDHCCDSCTITPDTSSRCSSNYHSYTVLTSSLFLILTWYMYVNK